MSPTVMASSVSWSFRARPRLSTRKATSRLGDRIWSRILITSSFWQTARHLIAASLFLSAVNSELYVPYAPRAYPDRHAADPGALHPPAGRRAVRLQDGDR